MEDSKGLKELVGKLEAKLSELDTKVNNYRKDMLVEYRKFTLDLLRDVPEDLMNEVLNEAQLSMAKYLSLIHAESPANDDDNTVTATTISKPDPPKEGRKSPPPKLYHTSGIPKMFRDAPRSPHDRDIEFTGLFTPSYLPLLDSNDRPAPQVKPDPTLAFRRASPSLGDSEPLDSLSISGPVAPSNDDDDDDDEVPVVEEIEEAEATPLADKGKEVGRPSTARELTDVSMASSVGSSSSETKPRRSAIRRSSSSARRSPGHVRFDFAGTVVLPTASPQPSESFIGALDLDASGPSSSAIDDSEEPYTGLSLSDVEGEEDYVPRPKRISSTEALRRLSRTPPEEGTVWTVVNPKNETPLQHTNGHGPRDPDPSTTSSDAKATASSAAIAIPTTSHMSAASGSVIMSEHAAPANGKRTTDDGDATPKAVSTQDEDDSEEEEFLAMKPKKALSPASSFAGGIGSMIKEAPTLRPPPSVNDKGKGKKNVLPLQDTAGAEEELFDLDDSTITAGSATVEKYLPEDDDDTPSEHAAHEDEVAGSRPLHLLATSPAVTIPARPRDPSLSPPPTPRQPMASIGSYKGAPLRMSVVVSPEVERQAAAMGDVKTYVGSVHGRTGIDPADESSYRASFSNSRQVAGTPRSFSERMMLEEAMGKGDDEEE